MHSAPRSRGGIGWFGWLLIIVGLCATVFNLALYYKITHPNAGASSSSDNTDTSDSAAAGGDGSSSSAISLGNKKLHDGGHQHHDAVPAVKKGGGEDNNDDGDDDGGDAAAARKKRHRQHRHHHEHDSDDKHNKKKHGGGGDDEKEEEQDKKHHRHHHHHNHKDGEQDNGEEEAAVADKKDNKHHHQHHHHHHNNENDNNNVAAAPLTTAAGPNLNPVGDADKQKMWDNQLKLIQDDDHHNKKKKIKKEKDDGGDVNKKEEEGEGAEGHNKHHHLHEHKQHHKRHAHGEEAKDAAAEDGKENNNDEKKKRHHHHTDKDGEEDDKEDDKEHHHHRHHAPQHEHEHEHHNHHKHHKHNKKDGGGGGDGEESVAGSGSGGGKEQQHQQKEKGGADAVVASSPSTAAPSSSVVNDVPPLSAKSKKARDIELRKKNRARRKVELQHKRDAFHISDTSGFSSISYDRAVANYANWTSKKQNIEQSSNHFEDIIEQPNMGVLLPDDGDGFFDVLGGGGGENENDNSENDDHDPAEEEDASVAGAGAGAHHIIKSAKKKHSSGFACDPDDSDFTPSKDKRCIAYLRNPRNWVSIKVMSSILSTGRTIKFKIFLRNPKYLHNNDDEVGEGENNNNNNNGQHHDGHVDDEAGAGEGHHNLHDSKNKYISAILKISQRKFLLEPASEVQAFFTDRFLNIRRVPPTVWAPVPLRFLQAACGTISGFYSGWFKQFVVDYEGARALLSSRHHDVDRATLNVSIQLWMNDVHDADTTSIKPSIAYEKYLQCYNKDKEKQHDGGGGGGGGGGEEKKSKYQDPTQWTELKNASLAGLTDVSLFDYVIGNSDRWFGHNMFVIHGAAGDDDKNKNKNNNKKNKPMPKFLFLDQGSSFYSRAIPAEIIYHRGLSDDEKKRVKAGELAGPAKDDANTRHDLCRFRTATAKRVLEIASAQDESGDFYHVLRAQMPRGIFKVGSPSLLKAAKSRLMALARMIEDCRKKCGDEEVFMW